MNITSGGAPAGYEFHDVEEEYVVDPDTGVGSWQRAKPAEATPAAVLEAATGPAPGETSSAADNSGQQGSLKGKARPKGPKLKKPKVIIPDE